MKLKVINLESKQTRLILPGELNYSYADGDQYFQWSPDGKWFLVAYVPSDRMFVDEVGYAVAPEPTTMILLGLGGLFTRRRRA